MHDILSLPKITKARNKQRYYRAVSKCDKSQGLMKCSLKCKEIIVKGRFWGWSVIDKKSWKKQENKRSRKEERK